MNNNITAEDRNALIEFLKGDPILTQSKEVKTFEEEWSRWVGVKHSVFLNSGASANLLTMAAIRHLYGPGEVIVPTLTWVSDIASVIQNGLTPVFVDIDRKTLGMNTEQVIAKLNDKTRCVFLTHVLGFNAIDQKLLDALKHRNIPLIEDTCESHGASFNGKRCGSIGFASNFSFYYAHHMSTIEGGMVCTNDEKFFQTIRLLRSHGMVREATSPDLKESYAKEHPDLSPDFIFAYPAYNVRSTELNAVLGRTQLKRLDANNEKRSANFKLFLDNIDSGRFRNDFAFEGSVNYAFTLILKNPDDGLNQKLQEALRTNGVEFRRGLSGGGNQLRQPYLRSYIPQGYWKEFPEVEHTHFYGYYIGNYPDLEKNKVLALCELINSVK